MVASYRQVSWVVIGTVGLWWVIASTLDTGNYIISEVGLVSSALLFISCFVLIGTFAIKVADKEDTLWDAVTTSGRRIAAKIGLINSRVVVEGAIAHNGIVWVCNQYENGTSDVSHRACPSCQLKLVERYVAASELDDHSHSETDSIDVLSCPHCAFAIRGQEHELTGADAALSRFEREIENMLTGDGSGVKQWRKAAKESLGREPTPAEIWDEYINFSEDDTLCRRTVGQLDDGERRAIDTYPAFAKLKQQRSKTEKVVDFLPQPLDVLAERLLQTDYLERKKKIKQKRDLVREKYVEAKEQYVTEHKSRVSSLIEARTNLAWPTEWISSAEFDDIQSDVVTLTRLQKAKSEYLTGAEYDNITLISNQFDMMQSYHQTAQKLLDTLEEAQTTVSAFESGFEPYRDHDRYLPQQIEEDLTNRLTTAQNDVGELRTEIESSSGPIPTDASEQLSEFESMINECKATLDNYESLFVDHEKETYPEVFQTEYGDLNEKQTLAVVRNEQHNLIDASAGTGKTLTLTRRIQYLYEKGTTPEDIVAITFTSDAAEEMRTRVADALGGINPDRLNIMTFHKLARNIVSRSMQGNVDRGRLENGTDQFLNKAFDNDDELSHLAPDAMEAFRHHFNDLQKTDPFELKSSKIDNVEEGAEKRIRDVFEQARNFNREPEYLREKTDRGDELEYHAIHAVAALLEVYYAYGDSQDHPIDHDHSIECASAIIRRYSSRYNDRYEHVLVDEFQDMSKRQLDFIDALLGPETTLFAVGDDWQCIYGFRGSKPEFFRDFDKSFDQTSRTTLEINYRCSQNIVDVSSSLMQASDKATTKNVRAWPTDEDSPEMSPVVRRLHGPYTDRRRAHVVEIIEELVNRGESYADMMVLSRYNSEVEAVSKHLYDQNIPVGTGDGSSENTSEESGGVTVQTVHKSKGTEAKFVIIVNAVDDEYGGMPTAEQQTRGTEPALDDDIRYYEEERRVFYVALTRAEKGLYIISRPDNISRYVDTESSNYKIVDDEVDVIEGELIKKDISNNNRYPTKLAVDCGSYDAYIAVWDNDILPELAVGEDYRFENFRNSSGGFKQGVQLSSYSKVTPLTKSTSVAD